MKRKQNSKWNVVFSLFYFPFFPALEVGREKERKRKQLSELNKKSSLTARPITNERHKHLPNERRNTQIEILKTKHNHEIQPICFFHLTIGPNTSTFFTLNEWEIESTSKKEKGRGVGRWARKTVEENWKSFVFFFFEQYCSHRERQRAKKKCLSKYFCWFYSLALSM